MYEEINLESIDLSTAHLTTALSTLNTTTDNSQTDNPNAQQEAPLADPIQITWLSHNSLLNCLFILTNQNQLVLYDCNSKNILKKVDLNSTEASKGKHNPFFFSF